MKAAAIVAAGALVGSAIASPHDRHQAFHARRGGAPYPSPSTSCTEEQTTPYPVSSSTYYPSSTSTYYPTTTHSTYYPVSSSTSCTESESTYYPGSSTHSTYYPVSSSSSYYPVSSSSYYPVSSSSYYPVSSSSYSSYYSSNQTSTYYPTSSSAYPVPSSYGSCTTYTTWITGKPTLGGQYAPHTVTVSPVPVATGYTSTSATVPTPYVTSYSQTGTYTVPASTITCTSSQTAPYPTSTVCQGTCTYGAVTTSVVTATTVTCPYATTSQYHNGGGATTYMTSTVYTCPSAGVYTVVPHTTTTCVSSSTIVYPTHTSYAPGTYTYPATTITVTKTNEVYTCPYETIHKPTYAPKPTYTPSPKPYTPTTYAPKPTYTPTSYAPKPTHSSYAPKPYQPTNNGNQWAITYTPYGSTGQCKSATEVKNDIYTIKNMGFTTVRTYSTDCNTLEYVGQACQAYGIKMIIGVFIESSGIEASKEQVQAIVSWGQWNLVEMVVIGNEAIFNGYCTVSELASYIDYCRSQLEGAGCHAPITTTEPVNIMQEYGHQLCSHIDVVAANIQPYFDANTSPSSAGEFVVTQLGMVKAVCPGLESYNLECGWPHQGGSNGQAQAGSSQQQEAIKAIVAMAGKNTAIFSYSDDMWKSPGYNGVEQYFGVSQCFSH